MSESWVISMNSEFLNNFYELKHNFIYNSMKVRKSQS